MSHFLNKAISIALALVISAILFATAFRQIAISNTSGWQPSVVTIFVVLIPVLGIIVFVVYLIREIRARQE